jgi:hypothetical protein
MIWNNVIEDIGPRVVELREGSHKDKARQSPTKEAVVIDLTHTRPASRMQGFSRTGFKALEPLIQIND